MDEKGSYACCSFSYSFCSYKETCMHGGPSLNFMTSGGKSGRTDDHVCFAATASDGFGDMESFLMMKKMFALKECGYWRSCARMPRKLT